METEVPEYRVQPAFTLGFLFSQRRDLEDAADIYRDGLHIAKAATAEQRAVQIPTDSGDTIKAGFMIDSAVLSVLGGNGSTVSLFTSGLWK